jgi:hypothetical protein
MEGYKGKPPNFEIAGRQAVEFYADLGERIKNWIFDERIRRHAGDVFGRRIPVFSGQNRS